MQRIGIGIIGMGQIGKIHANALRMIPGAELRAVSDAREETAKEAGKRYGVEWHVDYHDLLQRKDIDAVTIGVPNFLHAKVSIDAAKSGKHIAVEKPMCLNLKEADEVIAAVKEAGVLDLYCENLCFAPTYRLAKDIVDEGALGNIYLVRCREACSTEVYLDSTWAWDPGKSGGGCLIDEAVHPAGYARYVVSNSPAKNVYAQCDTVLWTKEKKDWTTGVREDIGVVMVRYEGGQLAILDADWCTPGGVDDRAEIYGVKGRIMLDLSRHNPLEVYSEIGHNSAPFGATISKGWTFPTADDGWTYGYVDEMRHFIDCIVNNRRPRQNLDDGRAVLEVIQAAYQSSATGRAVSLPL
jgi:predicted dehydrogenase